MKKVDLCCGRNKRPDWIGVDVQKFDGVDIVADLNEAFPFKDGEIDEIFCKDGIEHLHDKIHTMNEIHRVLKDGGVAHIVVPSTNSMGAFQDPTHVSFWNFNSFKYFTDSPLRDQYPDLITAKFEILQLIEVAGDGGLIWVNATLRKVNGDSRSGDRSGTPANEGTGDGPAVLD